MQGDIDKDVVSWLYWAVIVINGKDSGKTPIAYVSTEKTNAIKSDCYQLNNLIEYICLKLKACIS